MRTVGQVARLANVTVRALHHYDEIGLVRPSGRSEAGYRLYDEHDLERLQTVLFYRELGFGLEEIRAVIGDPDFDRGEALREQQRELQQEAEQRWGDTDAYQQSRRRTAGYTKQDWEEVKAESERIMQRIVEVYRAGAAPASDAAMDAVEAHRQQIDRRFYDCPPELQVALGEMYVEDPRFAATYEGLAEGLAVWVRDAIVANAARAAG